MSITTDDLSKIQYAVRNRLEFEASGLKKTAPLYETFLMLQEQMAGAPEGTMLEVVEESTWGQWDALIAATEKAHGIKYF
jgi:hypothetical protein